MGDPTTKRWCPRCRRPLARSRYAYTCPTGSCPHVEPVDGSQSAMFGISQIEQPTLLDSRC